MNIEHRAHALRSQPVVSLLGHPLPGACAGCFDKQTFIHCTTGLVDIAVEQPPCHAVSPQTLEENSDRVAGWWWDRCGRVVGRCRQGMVYILLRSGALIFKV
jgi:hypothetical protein